MWEEEFQVCFTVTHGKVNNKDDDEDDASIY